MALASCGSRLDATRHTCAAAPRGRAPLMSGWCAASSRAASWGAVGGSVRGLVCAGAPAGVLVVVWLPEESSAGFRPAGGPVPWPRAKKKPMQAHARARTWRGGRGQQRQQGGGGAAAHQGGGGGGVLSSSLGWLQLVGSVGWDGQHLRKCWLWMCSQITSTTYSKASHLPRTCNFHQTHALCSRKLTTARGLTRAGELMTKVRPSAREASRPCTQASCTQIKGVERLVQQVQMSTASGAGSAWRRNATEGQGAAGGLRGLVNLVSRGSHTMASHSPRKWLPRSGPQRRGRPGARRATSAGPGPPAGGMCCRWHL